MKKKSIYDEKRSMKWKAMIYFERQRFPKKKENDGEETTIRE